MLYIYCKYIYYKVWRKASYTALYITAFAALLCSCGKTLSLKPGSGGKPYEVLLAGDTDSVVYRLLSTDMPYLPQAEPQFDVKCIDIDKLKRQGKLARNIVVVDIRPDIYRHTSIRYERNPFAEPQMVVYVNTPTRQQLKADRQRLGAITSLMAAHENAIATQRLQHKHNTKMEADIKRTFGIDMRIPADMTAAKHGKDFMWISNNSPTAMTNICIYRSENRDSVMKANIKGETDDMYMATAQIAHTATATTGHTTRSISRGLWIMNGDAMGGPFVMHTLHTTPTHTTITVEAFVYAPGLKKRNLLLQTEAALFTAKTTDNDNSTKTRYGK